MIGKSVFTALTTNPSVSALISNRCYPLVLPQNATLPAVCYQVISRVNDVESGFLHRYRVQIACHAKTYDVAHDLANRAIIALESFDNRTSSYGAFAIVNDGLADDYDSDLDEYRVYFDVFMYTKGS